MTHKVEKVSDKAKRSMSKTNLSGLGSKKDKGSNEQLSNPGYAPNAGGSSATLPNKFDLDANFSSGFGKTGRGSGVFKRSGSDRKNRDPGVQSDDEDDMFKVNKSFSSKNEGWGFRGQLSWIA